MTTIRDTKKSEWELPLAFADADGGVVINFGVLTGREATQAELDRLADSLREAGAAPEMTITAERRQEYARGSETVLHQVHVSATGTPAGEIEARCAEWVVFCAEDRSIEPLA